MKAEDIIKKVDILDSERAGITSYWQDLANFCFPRKAWITAKKNTGDRLNFSQLFDSVAIRALQIMAAGFSSHLTNPSSKWFSLGTKDIKLMTSKAVQIWFKEVEEEIFSTLSTSNFEPVMQEFYLDSGCFGTGSILSEEDFKTRVRFTSIPLSEIYIEEDFSGRINRVYRQFEYTVQQAYGRWGDDAGEAVREQMRENKPQNLLKKLKFIHSVVPREYRDRSKIDNLNMPWQSQWVEVSKKENIAESGFEEFPYHTGRFNKLTGEVWGFSPAMNVLSDIRMVSAAKKTLIRAAMKMVDPPFIIPQRGFIQPLNFNPGGPNYSKS